MIARLFFVVLALLSSPSFAADPAIPATKETAVMVKRWATDNGTYFPVRQYHDAALSLAGGTLACQSFQPPGGSEYHSFGINAWNDAGNCAWRASGSTTSLVQFSIVAINACPAGYADVSGVCEKWVCPTGYTGPTMIGTVRMCEPSNPCADRDKKPNDFLWVSYNKGQSPYGYRCKDGCTVSQTGPVSHPTMNPNGDWYTGGTADRHDLMQIQYYAIKCEANAPQSSQGDQPPPKVPPVPKSPKCDPGEGVLTTSTGKVACVPEGTMGAAKPVESDTQKREEDANGVKNTTKNTTKDPVTGATTVTEKTTDANGNVISSSSSSSGAGGGGDNSGDEPGQCAKEPDSPICKKGTIKDKGKYGAEQDGKLEQAKAELSAKFSEIRGALSNQFRYNGSTGGGSLPCPAPVTVLGATISFCVADYSSSLSVIGDIIVFAATIIAAIIVVTA